MAESARSRIVRTVHPAGTKYLRALEHYETLVTELRWFNSDGPCEVAAKFDTDTRQHVLVVERLHPIPYRWSAIVGDLVQNLRNALDNMVSDIANIRGEDTTKTAFPICSKPELFKGACGNSLGVIPKGAVAVIKGFQPYQSGQPDDRPATDRKALWVLHELSNMDKHRTILVFGRVAEGSTFNIGNQVHDFSGMLPKGELVSNAVVARLPDEWFDGIDPDVNMHHEMALDIAFKDSISSTGSVTLGIDIIDELVMPVLFTAANTVDFVLDRLKPWAINSRLV